MNDFAQAAGKAALAVTVGLAGCSSYSPVEHPIAASRVANDPNTAGLGLKNAGSVACRKAMLDPTPIQDIVTAYNTNPYAYRGFTYQYMNSPALQGDSKVTSPNADFVLVPVAYKAGGVGAAGGGLIGLGVGGAIGGGRGAVATSLIGMVFGAAAGAELDNRRMEVFLENKTRCKLDITDGAYDFLVKNKQGYRLPIQQQVGPNGQSYDPNPRLGSANNDARIFVPANPAPVR